MRHLLPRLAGAALLLGLAAAPALIPAAYADDTGAKATISHVERSSDGTLDVLVSVPAGAQVDLNNVSMTIDGQKTEATAALAGTDTTVRRTAILAIDTSKSMRGARFNAANAAAQGFVNTVPADVYIGIVTFNGQVATPLAPTQDRQAALTVLSQLRLSNHSRLYDGVIQAVKLAGTEGQRSLLVLSDGADTTKHTIDQTPVADAAKAIKDAGILTDVVSLGQQGQDLADLQSLAAAGQGQLIAADPAALQAAFAAEAQVLADQVLVKATVPSSVTKTQATVKVTLPTAGGAALTAEAFSTVNTEAATAPTPQVATPAKGPWSPPSWVLYAGPGFLAIGLILLAVMLMPRQTPMTAGDRVTKYTDSQQAHTGNSEQGLRLDTDVTFATAKETAGNFLRKNQDLDARISARLEGAGSELKSSEWLLLHGAIFFISGLFGIFISGGNLLVGILFMLGGAVLPWMFLGFRRNRRRKAFNSGLPDSLQLISGSLAAGLSLAQSIDTIVREGQEPISTEFRRVLVETRLGVTLEDALEGVAERFESKDFEWVVMAIKIQRQVGGNLAELLDTVAATMREREYLRRQVAALAAEGKLSAYVLSGLPPLFMLYLLLTNYTYVSIMFHRPLGWAMMVGGVSILAVGAFWMSKLVKVEV